MRPATLLPGTARWCPLAWVRFRFPRRSPLFTPWPFRYSLVGSQVLTGSPPAFRGAGISLFSIQPPHKNKLPFSDDHERVEQIIPIKYPNSIGQSSDSGKELGKLLF